MSEGCEALLWLSICYSLLANSLFLAALKISVFPLSKKSISHENWNVEGILKMPATGFSVGSVS